MNDHWRLYTTTFSVLPSGGYPIRFFPDGSVETENLGMITHWILTEQERLSLETRLEESGIPLVTTPGGESISSGMKGAALRAISC